MAVTNKKIESLESQIAEVAVRKRATSAEIADLRKTLDGLRETDVSKAVERAGKLTAEILGRETVIKTLSDLETSYRSQLEVEVQSAKKQRRSELNAEIEGYFAKIEQQMISLHSYVKSPELAAAIEALGEVDQWGSAPVLRRKNDVTGVLEGLILPTHRWGDGEWVRRG